jgi:hypothetical protein
MFFEFTSSTLLAEISEILIRIYLRSLRDRILILELDSSIVENLPSGAVRIMVLWKKGRRIRHRIYQIGLKGLIETIN